MGEAPDGDLTRVAEFVFNARFGTPAFNLVLTGDTICMAVFKASSMAILGTTPVRGMRYVHSIAKFG
jgi:hypothetical protein